MCELKMAWKRLNLHKENPRPEKRHEWNAIILHPGYQRKKEHDEFYRQNF